MWLVNKVKKGAKKAYNVKRFMGSELLVRDAEAIKNSWKDLKNLKNKEKVSDKNFDAAMARLNITEDDLQQKEKQFLLMSKVYGSVALLAFAYTIFLIFSASLFSFLMGAALTFVMAAFFLREILSVVKIRRRSLTCTFKDLLDFIKQTKGKGE
tara:strand:+ start:46 stop:507 length:462 start_codon:yes stop_codon:yes gene_type:complete